MSYAAFRVAAWTSQLWPHHKLVLLQLAAHHNAETGQCNPSAALLSAETGLGGEQVAAALHELARAGHIARDANGQWSFPALRPADDAEPIPPGWWPSDAAIRALREAWPDHHFDLHEAVHEFRSFCHRRDIRISPASRDRAFVRNISALLGRRRPGPCRLSREACRGGSGSVGALLAGLR